MKTDPIIYSKRSFSPDMWELDSPLDRAHEIVSRLHSDNPDVQTAIADLQGLLGKARQSRNRLQKLIATAK